MSDKAIEVIAEALTRDAFGLTTVTASFRQAGKVLAALKAAGIAVVELPPGDDDGDIIEFSEGSSAGTVAVANGMVLSGGWEYTAEQAVDVGCQWVAAGYAAGAQ